MLGSSAKLRRLSIMETRGWRGAFIIERIVASDYVAEQLQHFCTRTKYISWRNLKYLTYYFGDDKRQRDVFHQGKTFSRRDARKEDRIGTLVGSSHLVRYISALFGRHDAERRRRRDRSKGRTARKIGPCTLNGHGRPREIREARVPVRRRIYNTFLSVTSAG